MTARQRPRLATRPLRAVTPADLTDAYTNPRAVLAQKARRGEVHKVAHGVYVAVPDDAFDPHRWRPALEAAAAAVATTAYPQRPVAVGLTAARLLRALPRAYARATYAVPARHADVRLVDRPHGVVGFVRRDVGALATTTVRTELGDVLVTTPEQTVLDLALNRTKADPGAVREAITNLAPRLDWGAVEELARAQRGGPTALATLRRMVPDVAAA
ncbi:hypothetical protein GXP71_06325 [Cellulomonas sp. H30R-01]|uniref:type IV toxin-antitoxin system AbiEi family antitoxin n=1 Tax=Cellulomonas sp. H30R-01 TaxID=2704467 RepID=UPI00138D0403|nr:type IV toxin-antitoxin system AbiEi family antitoxin [Cellulomonas sp. H30R-01]QHT55734.1 hypothetical protein GXP71_06325 [Cellulomonas sp. H30R-01]